MNLNEEALKMLKDQVSKLKLLSNELELKDRQAAMFKDTILSLEEQRDELIRLNQELSDRLQQTTAQASSERSQLQSAIGHLRDHKQQLAMKNNELQQILSANTKEIRSLAKYRSQLEGSNDELVRELKIVKEQLKQYSEQSSGTQQDLQSLQRQLRLQKELSLQHSTELQSLQEQLSFSQQQLAIFKAKYEEVTKIAEQQLRESGLTKAKLKQLQSVEKELQESRQEAEELSKQRSRLQEQVGYKDREMLIIKEANIGRDQHRAKDQANLEVDFRGLVVFVDTRRKPSEFYSAYTPQFEEIEKKLHLMHEKLEDNERQVKGLTEELQREKRQSSSKQHLLEQLQEQLQLLKLNCENQLRSVQITYQTKLQQLSIKLKRQELQLQRLRNCDKDFTSISDELEKLRAMAKQEEAGYRQEVATLKKQNHHLDEQIRELIPMCQESISVKNANNSMKLLMCHLLRHLMYVVGRSKQMGKYSGLIKGFWTYYQKVHWILRTVPKLRGQSQFRKGVIAVVAAIRIRKMLQRLSSAPKQIKVYKDKFLKSLLQGSITSQQNMVESSDVDMLSSLLTGDSESPEQIISVWSERYKWKQTKYKNLNIGKIASQDMNYLKHALQGKQKQ